MDAKLLGGRIRRRRKELGLSQEQLAAGLFTKSYVSQVERGEIWPSLPSLLALAQRLAIPAALLLAEPTEPAARKAPADEPSTNDVLRAHGEPEMPDILRSLPRSIGLNAGTIHLLTLLAIHPFVEPAGARCEPPDDWNGRVAAEVEQALRYAHEGDWPRAADVSRRALSRLLWHHLGPSAQPSDATPSHPT